MKCRENIELLFQYGIEYRFEEFEKLFSKLEKCLPYHEFWEAYLMRAQIKLYASDSSAIDDLIKVEQHDGIVCFPLFSTIWKADYVNRFSIFPQTHGALKYFLQSLECIREKIFRWYGEQGTLFVRQLQCDIYYFTGKLNESLNLANLQQQSEFKTPIDTMFLLIVQYRCNLALGNIQRAEEYMLELIRCSKANPECVDIYKSFRLWAIATTSWNGDSPRFFEDNDGTRKPLLKDRLESIKKGIARTTPIETPCVEYAERAYEGAYTLKQYYMDWFHAIYWFSVDDYRQAESYFAKAYKMAQASGLIMPIIECGEQIIPLYRYIQNSNINCSQAWLEDVITRAEHYENSLNSLYYEIN